MRFANFRIKRREIINNKWYNKYINIFFHSFSNLIFLLLFLFIMLSNHILNFYCIFCYSNHFFVLIINNLNMEHRPFQISLSTHHQQPADAQATLPFNPKPILLDKTDALSYQKKKALKIKALLDLNWSLFSSYALITWSFWYYEIKFEDRTPIFLQKNKSIELFYKFLCHNFG